MKRQYLHMFSQRIIEAPSRFSLQSAFMNGWAQYAENLGTEMGLYDDPYSLFGFYYVGRVLLYLIHKHYCIKSSFSKFIDKIQDK